MSYKLNPFTGKLDNTGSTSGGGGGVTSIDDLSDVDNSTTPPTDGQILVWDAAAGEYKPGTISGNGVSNDQYANFVTLLLTGDTDTTDSSDDARAVTVVGSSASSSTQFRAGGGSIHKTASSYLSLTGDAEILQWHNRPGGYSIDYWIYNPGANWSNFSSPASSNTSIVIGNMSPTSGSNYWGFGPNDSGVPCFYWYPGGPAGASIVGTTTLSLNTWHHLAIVCDTGNELRLYVNGVEEASTTSFSGTYSGSLILGQLNNVSPEYYIDHLRITTGVVRYTANFNPVNELPSFSLGSINDLGDVDTSTVAPTDGDVLVYDNANTEFVPGVRVKSDTTEAGTGSSAVTNIVTISETDYNALTTPAANTIYFIV